MGERFGRSRAFATAWVIVLAACSPPPTVAPSPSPESAETSEESSAPSCISAEIVRQLACPADAPPPVPAAPPVTWPSGDHLFHWGGELPWTRPLDPRALRAAVGRTSKASTRTQAVLSKLDAADRAFDTAAAPEAQADESKVQQARWSTAADAYAACLKTAPTAHPLRGYMLHRHVRALWNAGQEDDALAQLVALFAHWKAAPHEPGATELRALAGADLAPLYVDSSRPPADVASWLAAVTTSPAEARRLREAIAQAYLDRRQYDAAHTVLAALQADHPGASGCVYAAHQLVVRIVETPFDVRSLVKTVNEQLALRRRVEQSSAPAADRERCRAATLTPMVELASAWHSESVGWNGVLGSNDPRKLLFLRKLYDALAGQFTVRELDATVLRAVPSPNRPSRARVGLARAELERWRRDHERCGASYQQLYDPGASAALQAAAVAGAMACHTEYLRERRWPSMFYESGTRVETELGTRLAKLPELAGRYLCLIAPAASDPVGTRQRLDVELLRGRVFFLGGRWELAAGALQRLAFDQGQDQAREAAAMYAIALHQLAADGNAACGADLASAKTRLAALHCSGSDWDEALPYLARPGATTRGKPSKLPPCEALLAVGEPPVPPPPPPARNPPRPTRFPHGDRTAVAGAAIPEVIRWVLRLHEPQLRACYAAALRRDAFFEPHRGRVLFDFTVARDGTVSEASSRHHGFPNRFLSRCLTRTLSGMSFAQPEGGMVQVGGHAELSLDRGLRLSQPLDIWQYSN